jgi:phosphate transport system protein
MLENVAQHRAGLQEAGNEMLNLCRSQLEKSREAFIHNDGDLAEEVNYTETRVNALDLKIQRDCERYLALFNPVAMDLRFVMAILKINYDLERIADHAYNISKYVIEEDKAITPHLLKALEFEKMYETIDTMMDLIANAYTDNDIKLARKVFKKDKILDKINAQSFQILEDEIKKDSKVVREGLILFSVIKKLERVGDLIKNIAEEIIFYTEAEVIKHKKKK